MGNPFFISCGSFRHLTTIAILLSNRSCLYSRRISITAMRRLQCRDDYQRTLSTRFCDCCSHACVAPTWKEVWLGRVRGNSSSITCIVLLLFWIPNSTYWPHSECSPPALKKRRTKIVGDRSLSVVPPPARTVQSGSTGTAWHSCACTMTAYKCG